MTVYYIIAFLIVLLIIISALYIAQTINFNREKGRRLRDLSDKDVYKKRDAFLYPSEQTLFYLLKDSLNNKYLVIPQVNLLSFIQVDNSFENLYEEIDTLRKFTVDYLIIDKETTEPKAVVELDGKSHEEFGKKNRDHYLNQVCSKSNLPIIHIKTGEEFVKSVENINNTLNNF